MAAQTEIVGANTVLNDDQIRAERWNMLSLYEEIRDTGSYLKWLASRHMIRNSVQCNSCSQPAVLSNYVRGIDGKCWRCRRCNKSFRVWSDSFFARSHLKLQQIVLIIYLWAFDTPSKRISQEVNVSKQNIVYWCNFCREECGKGPAQRPPEIGGISDSGEPIVVEIDESKFFHRKYHRGRWYEGHWVFGGIERVSKKCILFEVPDRTSGTLEGLIERYIVPGSHIVSDGFESYNNIAMLNGGVYLHSVVVHAHNFVNPQDPRVHTQTIENMWMRAKRKFKRQFGTSRVLFASYIDEFMWRSSVEMKTLSVPFFFACLKIILCNGSILM